MAWRGIVTAILFGLNPPTVNFLYNNSEPNPQDAIQNLEERVRSFPQEKVYLHTDKSIYSVGENIWLKPYLVNASDHLINTPSSLLQIELVDPSGEVVSKLDIKMDEGWNKADIPIDPKWETGNYVLRGYTSYMLNYNQDYIFQKSIVIGNAFRQIGGAENEERDLQLEFFPEGGNIIAGLNNNVAFTCNIGGIQSNDIKGIIVDQDGNQVGTLMTYTPGYGKFELNAVSGLNYYAQVNFNGLEIELPLPEVIDQGFTLSANNRNEDYHIITVQASNKKSLKDAYVLAHVRGIPVALVEDLEGRLATFRIGKKDIPEGIMHVTLFDGENIPQCERLVYNSHPSNAIDANISIPDIHLKKRQKTEVDLHLADANGDPVQGDFSVAITDAYIVPYAEWELNVENYLLMMSDLDRPVKNPGYYFQSQLKNQFLQDLILLTHGWRRFKWEEILESREPELSYPPRSGFDISGRISQKGKPLEANLTVSLISDQFEVLESKSDANGAFYMYDVPIMDTTDVVFQATDTKNKKVKKAKVEIEPVEEMAIQSDNVHYPISYEQDELALYLNSSLENSRLDSFYRADFSIDLEEITVRSKREDINQRLKEERNIPYTDVDNRIILDSLKYIQPYYSIFDIVRLSTPGVQVVGTPGVNQEFRFRGNDSILLGNKATILINGVPVSNETANYLIAAEIEFIDVLRGLSKTALYGGQGKGGIVAIYTKSGRTPKVRKRKIEGLFNMEHPGYYRARIFPAPNYDLELPTDKKPDYRITLHWDPEVEIDDQGRSTIEFFTADRNTTYRLDLQGISSDGRPVSKQFFFDVKED